MNRKDMQWSAIKALQNLGGQAHRSKIRDFIIKDLGLTNAQINATYGVQNKKIFNRETSFMLTDLKNGGYIIDVPLDKKTGNWELTPQGQQAVSSQFPI